LCLGLLSNRKSAVVHFQVVDAAQYLERLQTIGVVIKSKNFIVVQDQMQSLVLASARERTELFEHMSRLAHVLRPN